MSKRNYIAISRTEIRTCLNGISTDGTRFEDFSIVDSENIKFVIPMKEGDKFTFRFCFDDGTEYDVTPEIQSEKEAMCILRDIFCFLNDSDFSGDRFGVTDLIRTGRIYEDENYELISDNYSEENSEETSTDNLNETSNEDMYIPEAEVPEGMENHNPMFDTKEVNNFFEDVKQSETKSEDESTTEEPKEEIPKFDMFGVDSEKKNDIDPSEDYSEEEQVEEENVETEEAELKKICGDLLESYMDEEDEEAKEKRCDEFIRFLKENSAGATSFLSFINAEHLSNPAMIEALEKIFTRMYQN